MSEAAPLPALVLSAITVVGTICTEVAFIINSSFCANTLFSFSSSPIALTAYGVAAPPIPKRLHDKFIAKFSLATSLSVLNSRLDKGFKAFEAVRDKPLFSASRESPIHTAYMQKSVTAIVSDLSAPFSSAGSTPSGEINVSAVSEIKNIHVKIAFINYVYELNF